MKVVHISASPVSGSPFRIVEALNKHTSTQANLVFLDNNGVEERIHPGGIHFGRNREQAMDFISNADILHFHEAIDLDENPFGVSFRKCFSKKKMLRQWHNANYSLSDIPELVIPQHQERFFPNARLVPNIIPVEDPLYLPFPDREASSVRIFFSPTISSSAWKVPKGVSRFTTKGAPEVKRLLKRLSARYEHVELAYCVDRPRAECLSQKQKSHIVIDDIITGGFHLVGLEGLSQGLPVLSYLDARTNSMLQEFTGASELPWINTRLEDAEVILEALIFDEDLRDSLGKASREWMLRYYHDKDLISHYTDAYKALFDDPEEFNQARFDLRNPQVFWSLRASCDLSYAARAEALNPPVNSLCRLYAYETDAVTQSRLVSVHACAGSKNPFEKWLHPSRFKRIDPNVDIFDFNRCCYLKQKYAFAASYAKAKDVVELGSGLGYGAHYLATVGEARSVTGVDCDALAVAYAEECYASEGVTYLCASGESSGLEGSSADFVLSYDVLEWVPCSQQWLNECLRLLRPGGQCLFSISDLWHDKMEDYWLRSYTPLSLFTFLSASFSSVDIFKCSLMPASSSYSSTSSPLIFPLDNLQLPLKRGESLLALCTP